ncbi:MAG: tail fiber protein [Gammaproteobacteria bacterium]|nr:tail fiber protein [Gammaproteobacteria bacterium]
MHQISFKTQRSIGSVSSVLLLTVSIGWSPTIQSGTDPFLAEINMFAGNFAPRGWAQCDGTLLSIELNQSLFSLLGNDFGGDGRTSFALPDMRGRVPIHAGQGTNLTNRSLGVMGGAETVTLDVSQIPNHSHTATSTLHASSVNSGNTSVPTGAVLADDGSDNIYAAVTPNVDMSTDAVTTTLGNPNGSQGHENMQPFSVINFIIAIDGTFPPRN